MVVEDLVVGPEGDPGAGDVGGLALGQRCDGDAVGRTTDATRSPSRRTSTSSWVDSALTTETPTPCSPPETE